MPNILQHPFDHLKPALKNLIFKVRFDLFKPKVTVSDSYILYTQP